MFEDHLVNQKMDRPTKFVLPAPNFGKKLLPKPHVYLTPSGMTLLPREKQPPPMYGKKGSTVPPKYIKAPEEPENPKPYCEACEMELQSAEDFRRHRLQHERCPVDGCKFKGHPNVMDKHVTELHSSGMFDKIKKLSTPEEIAAWRAERRKKYPTLANAKMRQLAQEQRERRGERLFENKARFGRHEDRKRARPGGNGTGDFERNENTKKTRNNDFKQHEKNNDKRKSFVKDKPNRKPNVQNSKADKLLETANSNLEANNEVLCCGIRLFGGTSKMPDYKHEKTKVEKTQNVLASLVGMYGSDDDDDDDLQEEQQSEKNSEKVVDKSENSFIEQEVLNENYIDKSKSTVQQEISDVKHLEAETLYNETETIEISHETVLLNLEKEIQNRRPENLEKNDCVAVLSTENESPKCSKTLPPTVSDQKAFEAKASTTVEKDKEARNIKDEIKEQQSNESSDEAPDEAPIQRTTTLPDISTDNATTSQPESIVAKRLRIEQARKRLQAQRSHQFNLRKRRIRRQNTMLEKLLEPEIRHERNVLLQCVRFVCANKFFGIGSETA